MVVCVFLSSTAPPPACMAKEGDNKTFAVIRGIISQSFSDLRTNPEVKQPQREQLPRWFPMKTIRQQIYRGVIVCNQVAQAQSVCMSMCVPGLYCTHAFMRASDEDPSGTKRRVCSVRLHWKSTLPASCGERKCYHRCPLIAGYTGSAEGGRQGKRRRSWRVVKQATQRERTKEEMWLCPLVILFEFQFWQKNATKKQYLAIDAGEGEYCL